MADVSRYDYYMRRYGGMKTERVSFDPHWKELAQFIQPRKGRFFTQDRNKGDRRWQSIINSRATQAHKIARAGMLAGIMSPARPWFNLGTPDPDMMEFQPVKEWLYRVEIILREIFASGNLYNMAPIMLGEELLFGTGCMLHVDDFEDVARFYTQTAGSYYLAQNHRLQVDTLVREYEMTAGQMAQQFGEKNLSTTVKNILNNSRGAGKDAWISVIHFIEPNPEFKPGNPLGKNKAFSSVYMETGCSGADRDKFLGEGGFKRFPAYTPRWELAGEDIYATDCPAMTALGDVKALQIEEKEKAKAIQKMVSPPLKGPASLKQVPISSLPGGATLYDGDDQQNGLRPIYQVQPDIAALLRDIQHVESRINEAFFVDLFKPITSMEGIQPRNQLDLSQRNQEAMLQLGPVLERQHGEFLSMLIDRTFEQAVDAKILPPAPKELQGKPLKVTYISTLAMAQKAVETGNIDRLAAFVGGLVQGGLSDGLKFDGDQAVDQYSQALGAPPRVIRSDEDVGAQRQQQQKAAQAAQMAELAQSGANTAKMLSDAKTGDDSVLTGMTGGARK